MGFWPFLGFATLGFVIAKKIFFPQFLEPISWPFFSLLASIWYFRGLAKSLKSGGGEEMGEALAQFVGDAVARSKIEPKVDATGLKRKNVDPMALTKALMKRKSNPSVHVSQIPSSGTASGSRADVSRAPSSEPKLDVRSQRIRSKVTRKKVVRAKRKAIDRNH